MRLQKLENRSSSTPKKMMLDWLSPDDWRQHRWVIDYLIAKREQIRKYPEASDYDNLVSWSRNLGDEAIDELLIRNMKAAWRQKQHRNRQISKKSYSFILDSEVKAQLDDLAKRQKKTIIDTLEGIIQQAARKAQKADHKKQQATEPSETAPKRTPRDW
jgi:macrodomain Ter protein organizer (MatP/YcbG family)